jgi:hypothetical protein
MYRNRLQPIRLGGRDSEGKQKVACSLEMLIATSAPEPATELWVDWEVIAGTAKWNRLQ